MLADVIDLLRCPHCSGALGLSAGSARCASGHSFDVARQGYLNLLPGDAHTGSADTAEMVAAREAFLAAGHYDGLADAVAERCRVAAEAAVGAGAIVDVGAGTGHYLARALADVPGRPGLALDISKHALRRAARAHPAIGAVACDAWAALPVRDRAAAVALSVFSPRRGAELARILEPGGVLVIAFPAVAHLAELVERLGLLSVGGDKGERLDDELARFELRDEATWEARMSLSRADVAALVAMGPSAYHLDAEATERRIAALDEPVPVTAKVVLRVYAAPAAR